jgi:hypothetical protein
MPNYIILIIIYLFLLFNFSIFPKEIDLEEESINKITECVFQKKIKKSEQISEIKDGEVPQETIPLKKEPSCTKEQLKQSFVDLLSTNKNIYFQEKIFFTTLVSLFVFIVLFRQHGLTKKIRDLENKLNQSLQTIHDILESSSETPKNDSLQINILNLEARQRGIEETLGRLLEEKSAGKTNVPQFQEEESTLPFYMPFPKIDGSFPVSSARITQSNSCYKFYPKDNLQAEFELSYNSEMLGRLLNSVEIYIEPACESINSVDFGALQISNIERGEAIRHGNTWKVIKKAKIKYD